MAGFDNDVVYGINADYSNALGGTGASTAGELLSNGQMWIGSTSTNIGGTHINVGTLSSPDSSVTIGYSSPNITLQVAGGTTSLKTLSDDVGTIVTPSGGNIQLVGHVVEQGATKFSTVVAGTNLLDINPMSPARWIVDSLGFNGTHTTIASAIASATSGDTILILPGTFTENLTLKAGVNLTALQGDSMTPTVTIVGNATFSGAGTVTIGNIRLQTNSAALLTVSGSSASIVKLFGCYLNCSNNTGISFSSSSSSAQILVNNCYGDLGTTGIALFSSSSAGNLNFQYCNFSNSGGSSTASTISAGSLNFFFGSFKSPITSSGTAALGFELTDFNTAAQNATTLTAGGSGSQTILNCSFSSGTASSISISTTLTISQATIDSSNTNAITGAGTINYQDLSFPNTSSTINTTTQATAGTLKGSTTTAPTAGFLGERISSFQAGGTPSNNTPTSLTSITLSAGNWDIYAIAASVFSGNSTIFLANISTTTNTIVGNLGDAYAQEVYPSAAGITKSLAVPCFRVTPTTSTTYFLVVQANFSTGTATVNGRITGVRVA